MAPRGRPDRPQGLPGAAHDHAAHSLAAVTFRSECPEQVTRNILTVTTYEVNLNCNIIWDGCQ